MPRRVRRPAPILLATLILSATACDDGTPSVDASSTEATVTGVVKVQGMPVSGGEVVFNPSNHLRIVPAKSAPIAEDGTYTIKTFTGGNEVSFRGDVATKNRGVGLIKEYVEVQGGENQVDFDLLGSGSAAPYTSPEKAKGKRG